MVFFYFGQQQNIFITILLLTPPVLLGVGVVGIVAGFLLVDGFADDAGVLSRMRTVVEKEAVG